MSVMRAVVRFDVHGSTLEQIYAEAEQRLAKLCGTEPGELAFADEWQRWDVKVDVEPAVVQQGGGTVWYRAEVVAQWRP